MSILAAILLGVLMGWLIEWMIDRLVWRKQTAALKNLRAENAKLRSKLEACAHEADNFQLIQGIGPEIAHRLNAAGIMTFDQLSQLSPVKMEALLGDATKHLSHEVDILEQARTLAGQEQGNL